MKMNDSSNEQKLWDAWVNRADEQAANDLIQNYMYLVNFHVERIASHLPGNVDRNDITSFGMAGLYDALQKFELDRNLKFDTYASFRIRGAIMDGLRKEDWLPRSLREKAKKIEQYSNELEQRYQRAPTSEEIAGRAGMTATEVESITKDALFAHVFSLEDKSHNGGQEMKEGIGYTIADNEAGRPQEQLLMNEWKTELAEGIRSLNEKEQLVISLFYHEELTFTEIGNVLGLTTSRISQIHKKAVFKLKTTLEKINVLD
ncbi:FliA/WhiG family RNA polymerase sigma factor [Virgibacillus sediminis]|uniref:FliA/WhiG family RNA polymerase sigma factor n=1 Tax=Virgibacillus sediminis TaxID=202260 RepID=A0ABV7AAD8_9BACI